MSTEPLDTPGYDDEIWYTQAQMDAVMDGEMEELLDASYYRGRAEVGKRDELIRKLCRNGYAGSSDPCYFALPGMWKGVTLTREQRDLLTAILDKVDP